MHFFASLVLQFASHLHKEVVKDEMLTEMEFWEIHAIYKI